MTIREGKDYGATVVILLTKRARIGPRKCANKFGRFGGMNGALGHKRRFAKTLVNGAGKTALVTRARKGRSNDVFSLRHSTALLSGAFKWRF